MDKYSAHRQKSGIFKKHRKQKRDEFAQMHKNGLTFSYATLDTMTKKDRFKL